MSRPEVTIVPPNGALDRLRDAACGESDWLWLLGSGIRPRDDALGPLLGASGDAAIVAGVAVDAAGRILVDRLPIVTARALDVVVELAERALLPIRATPFVNVLVRRTCFEHYGLPDEQRYGRWAPLEWSARVLRERAGYLVPASRVALGVDVERALPADAAAFVRMLRSGTWTRGDALAALKSASMSVRIGRSTGSG